MLDARLIRENPDMVRAGVAKKGDASAVDEFLRLDTERRALLAEVEQLKAERNAASKAIGAARQKGEDTEPAQVRVREINERVKELDDRVRDVDDKTQSVLLSIPNLPNESVPYGPDDTHNTEVNQWGTPRQFDFEPLPHWDLATRLGMIEFDRAGKVTGSRFVAYRGLGARLERAVMNFMMDFHSREHGYTELIPPTIVNRASMTGTGQLPKFEEDAYKLYDNNDYFLNPTAEVPTTNLHRDEILAEADLPIKYVAYCNSFRSESGSAGRDTRGIIRMHEFHKVELVKFVKPETSYDELEGLLDDACSVLRALKLPYHIMMMCTGDLGFTAAKKYDPEVWMPSYNRYVEISSVSNFESYQARRANIKYRPAGGGKAEFVHTLNGSGLAIDRTVAAIMENYQNADGSITVPDVLRPYMGIDMIKAQ
jgi:seryl-tRNA synthetase